MYGHWWFHAESISKSWDPLPINGDGLQMGVSEGIHR